MSSPAKNHLMLSYLDKIRKMYPYGVPAASIVARRTNPAVGRGVVCFLSVAAQSEGDDVKGHQALLEAICSKGLRLRPEEYLVEYHESKRFSEEVFFEQIRIHQPMAALLFGSEMIPGTVTTHGTTRVLHADSLKKIVGDLGVKKEFWKQLQENILPILHEG